jgi:type VI protein secretion system component VasA
MIFISSSHHRLKSQVLLRTTYYNSKKKKQKTSKKFTTVTNYQQTLVARSAGLWPFGLRKARQSPSSLAAATLHEKEKRRKKALPFELCKAGTLSYELLCIGRLSLYAFNTTF